MAQKRGTVNTNRVKRISHKRSVQARLDALSRAYGQCMAIVGTLLKEGEAPKVMARYRAFMKSLDGAIRHAQCQAGSGGEVTIASAAKIPTVNRITRDNLPVQRSARRYWTTRVHFSNGVLISFSGRLTDGAAVVAAERHYRDMLSAGFTEQQIRESLEEK